MLAAPGSPELADLVTAAHVDRILETALLAYEAVVVDAGSTLDERTMAALDRADVVLVPVYPEISALKAVHSFLDYLNEAGSIGTKTTFVLNSAVAKDVLKMRDIESGLGAKVAQTLPYDPFLYLKAVNEGNPVVLGAVRTPVSAAMISLAARAFGERAAHAAFRPRRAQVARPRQPAQADLTTGGPRAAGGPFRCAARTAPDASRGRCGCRPAREGRARGSRGSR